MKNNIVLYISSFISLIIGVYTIILYTNNSDLLMEIQTRDQLIKDIQKRDSLEDLSRKKTKDILSEYLSSDCGLEIDGKKFTLESFVKLLNDSYTKNNTLQMSLAKQEFRAKLDSGRLTELENELRKSRNENFVSKDSLEYAYRIINNIKKTYGIDYDVRSESNYKILQFKFGAVDSALLLFPYYRDRLKYDSTRKLWSIKR